VDRRRPDLKDEVCGTHCLRPPLQFDAKIGNAVAVDVPLDDCLRPINDRPQLPGGCEGGGADECEALIAFHQCIRINPAEVNHVEPIEVGNRVEGFRGAVRDRCENEPVRKIDGVVAGEAVCAAPAGDYVGAVIAADDVIAVIAAQGVVAATTADRVVTPASGDRIAAGAAPDDISPVNCRCRRCCRCRSGSDFRRNRAERS
jgi:hypothetical protein